jgi:hypothetical protein
MLYSTIITCTRMNKYAFVLLRIDFGDYSNYCPKIGFDICDWKITGENLRGDIISFLLFYNA